MLHEVENTILMQNSGSHRVTVEESFHWLAISKVRMNNLRSILRLDMGIENALRFNYYIGSLLAETMTTGEIYLNIP